MKTPEQTLRTENWTATLRSVLGVLALPFAWTGHALTWTAEGVFRADLEGATIEIKTRGGDTLIRTVVEVLHRDADYVLVRDSGKPSSA